MTFWIWQHLGTCSMFELTEEGVVVIDVRDLSDTETNVQRVKDRINLIAGLLVNGNRIVIRCVAGINRSNTLACGVMCLLFPKEDLDETWNNQMEIVKGKVGRAQPNPSLIDTVKKALWQTKRFKYWRDARIWRNKNN